MVTARGYTINRRTLEHQVQQATRFAADTTQSDTAPTADATSEVLATGLATASRTTMETSTAADVRATTGITPTPPETTQTHTLTATSSFSSGTTPTTNFTGTSATTSTRAPHTTEATYTGASTAAPSRATNTARRYGHGPTAYTYTTQSSGNASAAGSVAGTNTSYDVNRDNLRKYTDSTSTKRKLLPSTFKSIIPKTADGSPDPQYGVFVPDGYRTQFENQHHWFNQGTHI